MNLIRFTFLTLFLSLLFLFASCSSDSSSSGDDVADKDANVRFCKNSAQCNTDEECVNNVCVKKSYKDAGSDIVSQDNKEMDIEIEDITITDSEGVDAIPDVTADVIDITDGGVEYRVGIMSVYEGAAGECENDEYIMRSVSGYSGMSRMEGDEYRVTSGARFK